MERLEKDLKKGRTPGAGSRAGSIVCVPSRILEAEQPLARNGNDGGLKKKLIRGYMFSARNRSYMS